MKLGIGAIPHNLVIKSGGYTYYPLNQFEIDGTVAVELYRQDPEGEKKKIFIFKGEKDELKKFKAKFPVIKEMRSYNEYGSGSARQRKMVSTNTSDSYLLYKLAENLHSEAAAFNKKIKTGARLTPNELRAAGAGKKITPAQIKIIKPEYDKMKKFLAKPNANDHSLKYLRLVEKFGTEKELSEIRQIRMRHNIKGSISYEDQQKRDKIAGKYFKLLSPAAKKVTIKKTAAKKSFTLSDYNKNEAINDHSLNALRLVEKFGTEKELSEIRQIRMRHNIKGSISIEDQQKRDKIAGKYFKLLSPAVKKVAVKKTPTKKSPLRQTGSSNIKFDKLVQAMKPGKRTSASGGVYYERRADHSDKGKKL